MLTLKCVILGVGPTFGCRLLSFYILSFINVNCVHFFYALLSESNRHFRLPVVLGWIVERLLIKHHVSTNLVMSMLQKLNQSIIMFAPENVPNVCPPL